MSVNRGGAGGAAWEWVLHDPFLYATVLPHGQPKDVDPVFPQHHPVLHEKPEIGLWMWNLLIVKVGLDLFPNFVWVNQTHMSRIQPMSHQFSAFV